MLINFVNAIIKTTGLFRICREKFITFKAERTDKSLLKT